MFFLFFEQKGTLVLKEMLKIDSSGTSSAPDATSDGQNSANPNSQLQSKRRSSKKLGTACVQSEPESISKILGCGTVIQ